MSETNTFAPAEPSLDGLGQRIHSGTCEAGSIFTAPKKDARTGWERHFQKPSIPTGGHRCPAAYSHPSGAYKDSRRASAAQSENRIQPAGAQDLSIVGQQLFFHWVCAFTTEVPAGQQRRSQMADRRVSGSPTPAQKVAAQWNSASIGRPASAGEIRQFSTGGQRQSSHVELPAHLDRAQGVCARLPAFQLQKFDAFNAMVSFSRPETVRRPSVWLPAAQFHAGIFPEHLE